jgi:hypothetical protein
MGGGERISCHLASQTGFTDRVWLGGRSDLETSDQVVPDHPLEDRVARMAEATMPEFQVHEKGGGRGEAGSLWDGDGGTLKIGNGGRVHPGLKCSLTTKSEREGALLDVYQEVPVHGVTGHDVGRKLALFGS